MNNWFAGCDNAKLEKLHNNSYENKSLEMVLMAKISH